ncbi:thymidylate synthase [Leisingera aquaemixtae]|uniref:thymidylate synthase n=1 Tax=Leisingera sp. McT4-56 TaxID=2881255 RepID=UPI001C97F3BE|nr:thymidylate synthase [Leisingera sp. McT4-56]MBY6067066.1 thymidylate synthase [Leisingera aquaemixtae]MCB4455103.1 thymidylate synthase [Leisingera sp. McT4-56]
MRRFWLGLAVASALSACGGGNPFNTDNDDDTDTGSDTSTDTDTGSTVPASVAGDVISVNYVSSDDTIFITGIANDDVPYTRNAALDRTGSDGSVYQAYTYQEHSQAPHSTAYFREMEGGYAMVVATGNGPSGYYMSGTHFGSDGSFTAPTDGDGDPLGAVSYAGTYIGLLNVAGSGEDLLPTDAGTDPSLIPSQVAEVTGDVFILADFGTDGAIDGRIYNRTVVDDPGTSVADLELVPTSIGSDGTFEGTVEVGTESVGSYAGVFTGDGATAVAGTVYATDHISDYGSDVIEYGAFVIGQCATTSSHSDCPSDE